eukprot:gene35507-62530_t
MWQMAYKVVLLRVYDSPAFDAAAAIDAKKSVLYGIEYMHCSYCFESI